MLKITEQKYRSFYIAVNAGRFSTWIKRRLEASITWFCRKILRIQKKEHVNNGEDSSKIETTKKNKPKNSFN